ncbi:MAG: hypothetical protein QXW62_04845 [Candidatus Methanomethylicaceae archaeon]|nr:hypothetical protein [Candidatus Verstraetearchaeota archaeon]
MWLELIPNHVILNDPAYFSPKYFSQLFSIMSNEFRLFIDKDENGFIRFLIEVDDNIAIPLSEYLSILLKCSIRESDIPNLNYKYRLEATMARHYSFPISKKWSDDQQNIFHPPIPIDSIISSILTLGTAIEIISKPKNNLKFIKNKDTIEKYSSRIFECNIFIYGNKKESLRATLQSFPKTSKNWLIEYKIKKQNKWKFQKFSNHIISSNKSLLLKALFLAIVLIFLKNFNLKFIINLFNPLIFSLFLLLIIPILFIKDYKIIALSDYELASIFSFPSPCIPMKKPISTLVVVRNELRNE